MNTDRRYCKLKFSEDFILMDEKHPGLLKDFFSNFIVLRCDFDYASRTFEYTAKSELFKPLQEGYQIPEYFFIFDVEYENDVPVKLTYKLDDGYSNGSFKM